MRIQCSSVSKRFTYHWIIKQFNADFRGPGIFGVAGPNGSGKSTLLSLLSGYLSPTKGEIKYFVNKSKISRDDIFHHVAIAAPYIDLIEEFTIAELIKFYGKLKPLEDSLTAKQFLEEASLHQEKKKPLKHFSSGMKQKTQLLLALKTNVPILLLDEPGSFLDSKTRSWFYALLQSYKSKKLIILASNDNEDLSQCQSLFHVQKEIVSL